ncbi:hypothetical protein K438DRAFT_2030214 [Mycena galopus ATCC 62051]|nr:hypothetical protein K438DRAFT_2030214 [Mycena galopus ATCC 62051]
MSSNELHCRSCGNTFEKSHLLPTSSQLAQLRDVLSSTSWPNATVMSSFQSVVDRTPLELDRYVDEIRALEERLAALKLDRDLLQSYSDGCRSAFSPIRQLPTELLVEIFDLCSPPGTDVISGITTPTEEQDRLARNYLLQVSQVCSRWHGIVMGTPRLWSTITFDSGVWVQSSIYWERLLDLVEVSLKRGQKYPLTLRIAVDPYHYAERRILEILSRSSARWRNISLRIHPQSMTDLFDAKGNLPLLENLELSSTSNTDSLSTSDIFSIAPRLKSITFTGPGWPFNASAFPWSQLSHAKFDNGRYNKISLGGLPFLSAQACCEIVVTSTGTGNLPGELPPITSQLCALLIKVTYRFNRMQSWEAFRTVFGCLTLPRLTTLRFVQQTDTPPPVWNQTHFLHFATRSALRATLTQLEIYAIIQEPELLECLLVLPFLEELRLWDCADEEDGGAVITDNLLTQLAWRPDQTNLVPNLKTLGLSSTIEFRDESLWELVTSRIDPWRSESSPFVVMVLYVSAQREFSPEFLAQLSELEQSGDFIFVKGHI